MPQPPMKHIVESNALGEAGGVRRDIVVVQGAINPDPFANLNQVKAGSIVQSIDVDLEFAIDTTQVAGSLEALVDFYFFYNINGAQVPPTNLLVGQSHLKNQVFFQDQAFVIAQKPASFRFNLRIPRAYQQINDGDQIVFAYKWVSLVTGNSGNSWKFIYKEYFP